MIEIYGHDRCKYCKDAVALCREKGVDWIYLDVYDIEVLNELNRRIPGVRTVPQIFSTDDNNNWVYIGGFTELKKEIGD